MEIYKEGMSWTGKILSLSQIPDADKILRAEVVLGKGGRWSGVVRKDEFVEGDTVVVFLPDAIVPQLPSLSFMEPHKWRVKMMRLRGCPSEVLIVPISILTPNILGTAPDIGTDVTVELGVKKYEKEIPLSLSGVMARAFPSFISKTDEPNFQGVPELRQALVGHACIISTKIDGSSQTFFHRDGHLGGCSRNWELRDTLTAAVWVIAHRYQIPAKLASYGNFAIQWEACGPKIQSNPLKLPQVEPRVFDIWDIDSQKYLDHNDAVAIAEGLGLPFVPCDEPIIYRDFSDDDLRGMAEGTYESSVQREGIVIRPVREMRVEGQRLSFKVRNLLYQERG